MNDTKNKILGDITQLISGLGVAAQGAREELVQAVRARLDALLAEGALVTREEFEVVRDMAAAAREENAHLQAEINALKKKK